MNIAIIGTSIKFPQADSIPEFLQILRSGKVCTAQPGDERILHSKIERKNSYQPFGYLGRIDFFDHSFFNLSKAEANSMEPGQRLMLQCVCEAIEDSGYPLEYVASPRTGLFTTIQSGVYNFLYPSVNRNLDFIGGLSSIGGGRIANFLNITGPVMNIDTACSSALAAVHEAVQKIKSGEIDLAIVAGANINYVFGSDNSSGEDMINSKDGLCRAFDTEASGTTGGEGVAAVIMKRLDFAERDADSILAIIKGSAINNDGNRSNSITSPSPVAQTEVILAACKNANTDVSSVGYIESHGTGTKLGDPIEYKGIRDAFLRGKHKYEVRIGTLKPNIGHLNNVAGLAGLIKAIMVLKEKEFFPLANFNTLNKFIEEDPGIKLEKNGEKWLAKTARIAGVSSFGLSGTNVHVILEEYKERVEFKDKDPIWLKVSAKTEKAVQQYLNKIEVDILRQDEQSIHDFTYTLNAGRPDYNFRTAIRATSLAELQRALNEKDLEVACILTRIKKVNILLLSNSTSNHERYLECRIFRSIYDVNLGKYGVAKLKEEVLKVLCFQISVLEYFKTLGIQISNIFCNGSIARYARDIITSKNIEINDLDFDNELNVDLAKLSVVLGQGALEENLLVIIGANEDNTHTIKKYFRVQNPTLKVICAEIENSWSSVWCKLYKAGFDFNWRQFYSNGKYLRVKTPTYPFDKVSCWNDTRNTLVFRNTEDKVDLPLQEDSSDVIFDVEKNVMDILKIILQNEHVSLADDFFEVGGNSILGSQLINRINSKFKIEVVFEELYDCLNMGDIAQLVSAKMDNGTTAKKQDVFEPGSDIWELTPSNSQLRMWFESQLKELSIAYNIKLVYEIRSGFETEIFAKTLKALLLKHISLRSFFVIDGEGNIRKKVIPADEISIADICSFFEPGSRTFESILQEQANTEFDLSKGPLMRVAIVKITNTEYKLVFVFHHIIFDGWSAGVFEADFVAVYRQIKDNTYQSKETGYGYKDYVNWLNGEFDSEIKKHKAYWSNRLLTAKADRFYWSIGKLNAYRSNQLKYTIGEEIKKRLLTLATKRRVTLFSLLLASIRILLFKLFNNNGIIGVPVSGRVRKEFESLIGLFVNTAPLYTALDKNCSFEEAAIMEMVTISGALEHQAYPYDTILTDLKVVDKENYIDIMVAMQNHNDRYGMVEDDDMPFEIRRNNEHQGITYSRFKLQFNFFERDDFVDIVLEYNTEVFHEEIVASFMDTYFNILDQVSNLPEKKIFEIEPVSAVQKNKILNEFNATKIIHPEQVTVVNLFENQAIINPAFRAVEYEGLSISFSELNALANQFARYLKNLYDIRLNDLVVVKLNRSEKLIVAILGILKSGAAYVPIEPEFPASRFEYIKKDTSTKLVVDAFEMERFFKNKDQYDESNLNLVFDKDNLAYCIYTSGSTGNPKGVLNHHPGLYNRLMWMKHYLNVRKEDIFVQKTPYSFDVSVWEIFLPLVTGNTLVVSKPDGHRDPFYLESLIQKQGITVIHFVPSMLRAFLAATTHSNRSDTVLSVVCSGESLPAALFEECKLRFKQASIHNLYGPTEASIDVTAINLSSTSVMDGTISIGKPIDNTKVYIVNDSFQLQPFGVPGELLISGVQVAKGYLNLPQLTADRFIDDPFTIGNKLYRTGDLAQWLPDGNIRYIGRIDAQVKVRGNRIELGEIESAILQYEGISQSVVVVKEINGEGTLVAYYTVSQKVEKANLRNHLVMLLPDYMIPSFFVELETMPLTVSGKIDQKVLPDVSEKDSIKRMYVSPRNNIDQKLLDLWKEILGMENIGINDNFFELGGDSILSIRMLAMANSMFNRNIELLDLYKNNTIELLADKIDRVHGMYVHQKKDYEEMDMEFKNLLSEVKNGKSSQ
jgi:amino acid adenylation domain-containing protein